MSKKFCKIFEVEDHQVLYRISLDEESEEEIIMTTHIEGVEMTMKVGGFEKNNTTADIQFERIDQAYAEKFYKSMNNLTK
jgi:hypothetical protein